MPNAPESDCRPPGPPDLPSLAAVLPYLDTPLALLDTAGRIQAASPAFPQPAASSATVPPDLADLLPEPDEAATLRSALAAVAGGAGPATCECLTQTGTATPVRVRWTLRGVPAEDGPVHTIIATAFDCSAQDAAEAAHRTVLASISDAVFVTDDAGRFTFICPNVNVIFGYSVSETAALGTIAKLLGNDALAPAALPAAAEVSNIEHVVVDCYGTAHDLLINVKVVAIHNGTRLYTCRDVTERKQAERSLRAAQEQLAHAMRLSTMGQIASGLAHELNQPLAAISNFAQACVHQLAQHANTGLALREPLEHITAQAHRAAEIVRGLRSFVARRTPPRAVCDSAALVQEALQLVQPTLERAGITLAVELEPNLPPVHANPVGIQQVLINLIHNAHDAIAELPPERRTIDISAKRHDAGTVEFRVADRGAGVAPEMQERLFEPFATTRANGMGLGLSICHTIITAHEGCLWHEAPAAGGAVFAFTLPADRAPGTVVEC